MICAAGIGFRYWRLRRFRPDTSQMAVTALRARSSQVPGEGFQLSNTFAGSSYEQFVHNIIGISGGGSVISKQWNYCAQGLNLFADALDILLFLAQNFIGIFHRLLLRNARAQAETVLRLLLTRSVRNYLKLGWLRTKVRWALLPTKRILPE